MDVRGLEEEKDAVDDRIFEYYCESDSKFPEIQSNLNVKKNLQLQGDKSISISKETDDNIPRSEARPLTITPDNISSKFMLSKPSSSLNNQSSEPKEENIKIKPKENQK